jgi:DNA polymerase-1
MITLHAWQDSAPGQDVTMIMQVHDELVFEVLETDVETVRAPITEMMNGAATLKVPLVVDIGIGANWDEAH